MDTINRDPLIKVRTLAQLENDFMERNNTKRLTKSHKKIEINRNANLTYCESSIRKSIFKKSEYNYHIMSTSKKNTQHSKNIYFKKPIDLKNLTFHTPKIHETSEKKNQIVATTKNAQTQTELDIKVHCYKNIPISNESNTEVHQFSNKQDENVSFINNAIKTKRSPLKSIPVPITCDEDFSELDSSDKENNLEMLTNNHLHEKTVPLIHILSEFQDVISKLENNNFSPSRLQASQKDFKVLMTENYNITSNIITLIAKLTENNMKVINIFENSSQNNSLKSIKKKKITPKAEINNSPNDIQNEISLRKLALENSARNISNDEILPSQIASKKSSLMFQSMKSNIKILKTPVFSKFETPNTRCKTIVYNNVQKQLEKLFDT